MTLAELINLRTELEELNNTPIDDIEIEIGPLGEPNPIFDINQ